MSRTDDDPGLAFDPDQSCMDVLDRALRSVGDDADRISIYILHKDGCGISQFSNARSAAELIGIIEMARGLNHTERDTPS